MSLLDWPAPSREQELHAALLDFDSRIWDEVASVYVSLLSRFLLAKFPWYDPHLCTAAADRTVFDYLQRPTAFDPTRSSLKSYLLMSADRDLKNELRREGRHFFGRDHFDVELSPDDGNEVGDGPQWDDPRLQACLADLAEPDRDAVELMRGGERSTEAFARVWGCADLDAGERERAVKRNKDRLLKHLQRRLRTDG